jgi:DNA polymerase III delta prime subunit/predicted RNA-binding protein with RPS1 domain
MYNNTTLSFFIKHIKLPDIIYQYATMNAIPQNNMMGGSSNNMMDSLKSNMMTMLMLNNMNGGRSNSNSQGNDMLSMIYVFVATSLVDFVFKNAPTIVNFVMKKYTDKLDNIKKDLSSVTKDLTDNKLKKKTASITITVNVNNSDNILGHAILDFITNSKNTTHVSYIRENFILNQKDVINIDDEVFARMTQSSDDASTSTNINSGSGPTGNTSAIVQIIEIYSFTKTTDQLRSYLDDIKQKYAIHVKNKLGNKRYYFNMHQLTVPVNMDNTKDLTRLPPYFAFVMKQFQTNRKFSNLFGEDIEIIRNRVNFFCKNRKWYDEKGIPYTLGLLLSGAPGTGKTSTIKCLANETNRHICNINLNNDMTKTQLENLFFNENLNVINPILGQTETYCIPLDQRIYVLEDVDCQSDIVMERTLKMNVATHILKDDSAKRGVQRNMNQSEPIMSSDEVNKEPRVDSNKVDLSFLLNLLDGVLENPGRIVIMTSNHPDTLDSALIRPGRIDVIAKFRNCSNTTIKDMIEFFYDTKLSEEDIERIYMFQEGIITPAELSKVMFEHFTDVQATISHMEKLSETHCKINNCDSNDVPDNRWFGEDVTTNTIHPIEDNITSLGVNEQPGQSAEGTQQLTSEVALQPEKLGHIDSAQDQTSSDEVKNSDPENLLVTQDDAVNGPVVCSRTRRNVIYVFTKYVLPLYTSPENINKKDGIYYGNLLNGIFFSLKFIDHIKLLKTRHKAVVTSGFDLEMLMDPKLEAYNLLAHYVITCYRLDIVSYFTKEYLQVTGIIQILESDNVIERGYGTVQYFVANSCSGSLEGSFSVF